MASKFEIYKNKSGGFRCRPIHKAKANSISGINSVKENATSATV